MPDPKTVRVQMSAATLRQIAELTPAVGAWAASEGETATAPGDVIALAVAILHAQVSGRTAEILELDETDVNPLAPFGARH